MLVEMYELSCNSQNTIYFVDDNFSLSATNYLFSTKCHSTAIHRSNVENSLQLCCKQNVSSTPNIQYKRIQRSMFWMLTQWQHKLQFSLIARKSVTQSKKILSKCHYKSTRYLNSDSFHPSLAFVLMTRAQGIYYSHKGCVVPAFTHHLFTGDVMTCAWPSRATEIEYNHKQVQLTPNT